MSSEIVKANLTVGKAESCMWQHGILHLANPALGAAIVHGQRLVRRSFQLL